MPYMPTPEVAGMAAFSTSPVGLGANLGAQPWTTTPVASPLQHQGGGSGGRKSQLVRLWLFGQTEDHFTNDIALHL